MNKVDAVILAGAPAGPEMAPEGGLNSRAMVRVGEKTMLQWVVDALTASASVGRIVAVGEVTADGLDRVIEPADDLVTNITLGLDELGADDTVLIVCSDIPLLTAKAVDDFVGRAGPLNVDMAYPILPKSHCEKRYPDLKRTYLKTADGVFTGGNIFLLRPGFVSDNYQTIANVYAARKRVFKLARMIGMGVLLRVIVAQVMPCAVTVAALERAASRMLGAKVAAVVSAYPEIGEDVDKPADLEVVRRIIPAQHAKL